MYADISSLNRRQLLMLALYIDSAGIKTSASALFPEYRVGRARYVVGLKGYAAVIGKVEGVQVIVINTSFGVAKIGMSTALPTDFKHAEEVVKCMQKALDLYKIQV